MPKSTSNSCTHLAWAGLITLLASGCVGPQRAVEKAVYCHEAKQAYKACGGCALDCESARHFERGWRRGYVATALGRSDCPPAVPPHPYLGKRYQSPDGQQLTSLWFAGYEEGAAAARRCGRGPQVFTHEVGCPDGCPSSCTAPAAGVLPDANYVVMLQAASYQAPIGPSPEPSIPEQSTPTVEPATPERIPAAEVEGPRAVVPASKPAVAPSLRMPEPLSDLTPISPARAPTPRSYRRMTLPTQSVTPSESSSVTLAYPAGAGDLPAIRVMPTSFAAEPALADSGGGPAPPAESTVGTPASSGSPSTAAEAAVTGALPSYQLSETSALSFPDEPAALPAVATRATERPTATESETHSIE